MDDEAISQFTAITGASAEKAEAYLRLADGSIEQAVTLFFEDPNLDASAPSASASAPAQPSTSHRKRKGYTEDAEGVIHIDSEDEDEEMEDNEFAAASHDADAEMARRLQEEMYASAPGGEEEVRAPIRQVQQTLVGDDDYSEMNDEEISRMVAQQTRERQRRREQGRAGIFNQRDTQTAIWEDNADPEARARSLAEATGGASQRSTKASSLAEMFRPPFEIISRFTLEEARDEGKDGEKWLIINIQDPSIFDCQVLNRDLWKNKDVVALIKEHFIFLQYARDDPRGNSYIQYYFANDADNQNAYPHIAIVDPRTGEQVKTWSGPPVPKASDFLMQLYEFLDRYSLNEDAKNPVAKRKPEKKAVDLDRMTEEQMLEMALQNSLANEAGDSTSTPTHHDPDELTKSISLDKGKDKASSEAPAAAAEEEEPSSPFAAIPSDRPHTEPANDPSSTTRIQFRYSGGRVVRRFSLEDNVSRIYEWLKAAPLDGTEGQNFDLIFMGRNLLTSLDNSIADAGLKNGTVMVEFSSAD